MTATWATCKIPPCLARLLAKENDLLMSDGQLMAKLGWTRGRLKKIYRAATWENVSVGDMDCFLGACNLEPAKQRRYLWLYKRALNSPDGLKNMRHLRTAGQSWRASMVESLLHMVEKVLREHAKHTQRNR